MERMWLGLDPGTRERSMGILSQRFWIGVVFCGMRMKKEMVDVQSGKLNGKGVGGCTSFTNKDGLRNFRQFDGSGTSRH